MHQDQYMKNSLSTCVLIVLVVDTLDPRIMIWLSVLPALQSVFAFLEGKQKES